MAPRRTRESQTSRCTRASRIAQQLRELYPNAVCALQHRNAYQLLAATILSAQCTDERVNMVTPALFERYPDVASLAQAKTSDVEAIIRSTGFFRAKANSLIGMAQTVVNDFGGELPQTIDELIRLPGVGRKTANVLLGTWHRIPAGVVVDTHVKRITRLLGLTKSESPEQIEVDLMALLPADEWIDFSHRLIYHGRAICIARRPQCLNCRLRPDCDRVGLPPLPEPAVDAASDPANPPPDRAPESPARRSAKRSVPGTTGVRRVARHKRPA